MSFDERSKPINLSKIILVSSAVVESNIPIKPSIRIVGVDPFIFQPSAVI